MATITSAALRAEADRLTDIVAADADDQLANGWDPAEVAVVMSEAMDPISDLLERADAIDAAQHELTKAVSA